MSTRRRAAIAGRASQARLTPEQRKDAMRRVRMAAHVKAVAEAYASRAPELSPEQISRLRAIFGGAH